MLSRESAGRVPGRQKGDCDPMRIQIGDFRSRICILDKNRNFPFATGARVGLLFMVVLGFVTAGFARDRGPRVEVVCPAPPIPVRIDKQQVLVYELHVTNFDMVPLTLKRFEVLANEENSGGLSTLDHATLLRAMTRIGEAMVMSDSDGGVRDARVIEPGGFSFIYVWIELQPN